MKKNRRLIEPILLSVQAVQLILFASVKSAIQLLDLSDPVIQSDTLQSISSCTAHFQYRGRIATIDSALNPEF